MLLPLYPPHNIFFTPYFPSLHVPSSFLIRAHPPTQVFASSFIGEGVNSQAIRNSAGHDIFWIPNFWSTTDVSQVCCLPLLFPFASHIVSQLTALHSAPPSPRSTASSTGSRGRTTGTTRRRRRPRTCTPWSGTTTRIGMRWAGSRLWRVSRPPLCDVGKRTDCG